MEITSATATVLFVGSEQEPRQVVQARIRASGASVERGPLRLLVVGEGLSSDVIALEALAPGGSIDAEVGVRVDAGARPGTELEAELVVEHADGTLRHPFEFLVAEPGWRMFMISHFHYDPVWWNTQAAYTESWGDASSSATPSRSPGSPS